MKENREIGCIHQKDKRGGIRGQIGSQGRENRNRLFCKEKCAGTGNVCNQSIWEAQNRRRQIFFRRI